MRLGYRTGSCFFGPAQCPGGRTSGVEAFERDERPFFTARTPAVQALYWHTFRRAYPKMTAQFWQPLSLGRAAQKAIVPDAHKTFGQDVQRKPPYELQLRELHASLAALLAIVFVAEAHLALPNSL